MYSHAIFLFAVQKTEITESKGEFMNKKQQEEQERLAHEQQLEEDRKELLRLKQGVIQESDTIYEEQEPEKQYTFREKVSNFFYHNQWWLGFGAFFAVMIAVLIWQIATTVRPDMIILLLTDDDNFDICCAEKIETLFESYIDDQNNDGKVAVDVYYIPTSDKSAEQSGYTGNHEKLIAEFQTGEAVLVISDDEADKYIVPDHTLDDLEQVLGEYQETENVRFMLKDTEFVKYLSYPDSIGDDVYIGLRKVKETMDSKEKMQKVYDISLSALQKFAEQFGHSVQN